MTAPAAPAMWPCPHCGLLQPVRVAPSGSVRYARHTYRDQLRFGKSCAGTGRAVSER